jgi:post-segregation antitoxin (ccd killing protein)
MTYVPCGPTKPVNMTLSEDVAHDARTLTTNISDTVEKLLADDADAERRRQETNERLIDETTEMAKAHYAEHGLWGEEFSTLWWLNSMSLTPAPPPPTRARPRR